MAWTETCKIDFKKQIEHKKSQGISLRQALKQLSEESDIPIGTLTNWIYPDRNIKYKENEVELAKISVAENDNTPGDIFDGLSKDEKIQIIKDAENQILQKTSDIRAKKRYDRDLKEKELKAEIIEQPIPSNKYQTIVVDPPWPVKKIIRDERPNQGVFDYPTMSIEEIVKLKISDLTSDNCHIYLWTTHKFLPVSFLILEEWGFKYQCLLTWVKNVGMTPFSWMYSTEHCLFGRKGSLDLLKLGERLDFNGKVREHSRKPDEFYELVKRVSPGPRIDCFSREQRGGFDQFGNEQDKF